MLNDLKFVRGAVSSKDYQPALTHFLIKDGRVIGFDGVIALSSPIDLDITAAPKAVPFVKAIERCTETVAVNITKAGRITIKSGKFRATIECTEEKDVLEQIQPEGEVVTLSDTLLEALKTLSPFIGTDASRPWSSGILLRGQSAYATNNIILAEYWLGEDVPEVNIPASAIKELVRIGEYAEQIQLSDNSITFRFGSDRWLRSQLLTADWPDITSILDAAFNSDGLRKLEPSFFESVETLAPFVGLEGMILFRENLLTTSRDGDIGATVEHEGLPDHGAYNFKMLRLLEGVVEKIDFTVHPKPCPFSAPRLRGVFMGMTDA